MKRSGERMGDCGALRRKWSKEGIGRDRQQCSDSAENGGEGRVELYTSNHTPVRSWGAAGCSHVRSKNVF
jgi:hypothetical protein